jgi:hypothetical protein
MEGMPPMWRVATNTRRVRKEKYITCKPIGKIFMLIIATLPLTFILYL